MQDMQETFCAVCSLVHVLLHCIAAQCIPVEHTAAQCITMHCSALQCTEALASFTSSFSLWKVAILVQHVPRQQGTLALKI